MPLPLPVPEPVHMITVCSVCDLPWESHVGQSPTVLDCILLLKAKIASAAPLIPTTGLQQVFAPCGPNVGINGIKSTYTSSPAGIRGSTLRDPRSIGNVA